MTGDEATIRNWMKCSYSSISLDQCLYLRQDPRPVPSVSASTAALIGVSAVGGSAVRRRLEDGKHCGSTVECGQRSSLQTKQGRLIAGRRWRFLTAAILSVRVSHILVYRLPLSLAG